MLMHALTHLLTLRDLLLTQRIQWYNEPCFIDQFERLSCLVAGANCHFFLPPLGIEPGLPA